MSPKNRKVDDAAGDDIAEDDSFEDDADDDSFDDDARDEDEDYEDDYEDENDYEDEGEDDGDAPQPRETPAQKRKRIDRVNASARAADIKPGQSNMSVKWAIDRLDAREKRFSFSAAVGAALFGLLYFLETHNHKSGIAKGQLAPEWILILGLAAAALLVGATILGRRAPVGFVALFTGAMFGNASTLLGLPFFALAVWLLYRSYKIQKETTARLREAGVGPRARPTREARPSARAARPAAAKRPTTVAEARRARSKKNAAPVGNKRYTPKRPIPPPPKPSRRERKAAASD
jgi:hypothetical protein